MRLSTLVETRPCLQVPWAESAPQGRVRQRAKRCSRALAAQESRTRGLISWAPGRRSARKGTLPRGLRLLPGRRALERPNAWTTHHRRLSRDRDALAPIPAFRLPAYSLRAYLTAVFTKHSIQFCVSVLQAQAAPYLAGGRDLMTEKDLKQQTARSFLRDPCAGSHHSDREKLPCYCEILPRSNSTFANHRHPEPLPMRAKRSRPRSPEKGQRCRSMGKNMLFATLQTGLQGCTSQRKSSLIQTEQRSSPSV